MIDLYEIASKRQIEQIEAGENTRASLYVSFNIKYKVRKFPTGLCKLIQLGVHPSKKKQ